MRFFGLMLLDLLGFHLITCILVIWFLDCSSYKYFVRLHWNYLIFLIAETPWTLFDCIGILLFLLYASDFLVICFWYMNF